jgi:hypothetical protein
MPSRSPAEAGPSRRLCALAPFNDSEPTPGGATMFSSRWFWFVVIDSDVDSSLGPKSPCKQRRRPRSSRSRYGRRGPPSLVPSVPPFGQMDSVEIESSGRYKNARPSATQHDWVQRRRDFIGVESRHHALAARCAGVMQRRGTIRGEPPRRT